MCPQPRLAFHCTSAGLIQSKPVIKQAKKNTLPVGYGLPTDTKCFAHAGISRFVLSVASGREQCGDAGRGQESASFHRCLNVEHEQVFLQKKFSETKRRNFDVSFRNSDETSAVSLALLIGGTLQRRSDAYRTQYISSPRAHAASRLAWLVRFG
jgi:hypothetical protein